MTDNAKSPILSKNVSSSIGLEPPLRFPGFEGDYKHKKLKDIAKKIQRKDQNSIAPIMMLSAGAGFINQSEKYSRDNAGQSLAKYTVLNKGELAYNHGASKQKPFGCCYMLTEDSARIPYVYHCFAIPDNSPSYVATLLNNRRLERQLKKLISSSVRMDGLLNISYDEYMSVDIFLPSLAEQQKIADFLSLVDERIEKQRQLVEVLKRYKRGLFLLLFDGKQQNNILSQIIEYGKAGGTPTSTNKNYYSGTIPFLSISDMTAQGKFLRNTEKHISELGLKNSTAWLVPANSLIISMYASYGLVSINTIPITTSQAMFSIIPKDETDTEYLYYYLSYLSTTGYYDKMVSTGTQANLNAEKVKNIPIYFPSKEERTKIKVILKTFDEMEDAENRKLETLLDIKSGLLQQMFI